MVLGAVSHRLRRRHQLGNLAGDGQGHPGSPGRGLGDAHVLVVQLDPEAGPEVPREHGGRLPVEDGVPGQPAREHLQATLAVHSRGFEQHQRLADQRDDARDEQLVGGLHGLAGAGSADVDDGLAHGLEDRLGGRDVLGFATHHDRQRALDGAGLAAADRRVEDPDPLDLRGLGDGQRGGRGDRAHVDEQQALARRVQHTLGTEDDRLDIG